MSSPVQSSPAESELKDLFVHGLWRSGSTFIARALLEYGQESSKLLMYYEPLHETLATRTLESGEASHNRPGRDKAKIFRHPNFKNDYFAGYPYRNSGGVSGFDTSFTLGDYALSRDATHPGMLGYLKGLLEHAHSRDMSAGFKFNRSALRAEWMKENLGGFHAYLVRNPQAIFESCKSFVESNDPNSPGWYFLACPTAIVGLNSEQKIFSELAQSLGITKINSTNFSEILSNYEDVAKRLTPQNHVDIAAYLWAAGIVAAEQYADTLIDMDTLHQDEYRQLVENAIADGSGHPIRFDDIRALPKPSNNMIVSEGTLRLIKEIPTVINPHFSPDNLGKIIRDPKTLEYLDNFFR